MNIRMATLPQLLRDHARQSPKRLSQRHKTRGIWREYDFSQVQEYSDLEFRQIEVSGRVTRRISENTSFYVGAAFYDLDDETPYTYGDMSGSAIYTYSGMRIQF